MTLQADPPQTLARGVPGALSHVDSARAEVEAALRGLVEAQRCLDDNPRTAPRELAEVVETGKAQLVRLATRLGSASARVKAGA